MADAEDLKSFAPEGACRFESCLRHFFRCAILYNSESGQMAVHSVIRKKAIRFNRTIKFVGA